MLFVAAGHLTAGSREMLLQEGINYFDSSGTLYFRHATWLVDIDRPPRETSSRRIGSLFAGAREQVVHAMLVHWHLTEGKFPISGAELAHMAATSTYTVSRTLQEMERLDWLQTTGSGPSQRRLLSRPAALLDAWAAAWTQRSEVRSRWYAYAPRGGIVDVVLQRLVGHEGWAITGAAAANAAVPHLSVVDRVVVIVAPGSSDVLAGTMQLKSADKGHNVILVEREGASLLFLDSDPERPGSRFASPFVQYLDLLDGVGRNKELASELRRQVLKIEESDVG
ncbi:MAG: type IV toxin-antitoxin system AbiEi family antitoxin [Betaproteobacteria bacterium]